MRRTLTVLAAAAALETSGYANVYGDHVIMVEYRRADFTKACAARGASLSIILRDVNVVPAGRSAYRFDSC